MAHHVASTEQEIPLSPFTGGFRPIGGLLATDSAPAGPVSPPARRAPIPKGTMHAVPDLGKETVCGVEVATLYDFPDFPWPPTRPVRCLLCRQWVEIEGDEDF